MTAAENRIGDAVAAMRWPDGVKVERLFEQVGVTFTSWRTTWLDGDGDRNARWDRADPVTIAWGWPQRVFDLAEAGDDCALTAAIYEAVATIAALSITHEFMEFARHKDGTRVWDPHPGEFRAVTPAMAEMFIDECKEGP